MENLSLVLLKSAAWLTGFALVYLLMLRNERYFRLNRFYLLTGIIASFLFPFYTFHYAVVLPSLPVNTASVGELSAGTVVPSETSPLPVYFWIYLTGMTVFLFRLLFQTWGIIRKLQKSGYEQNGAVKLVRTSEYLSSFSFFSFVFVNPSTASIEMEEIMNHEREHIQQRHWFDLLLVELLCIVQWFNPFAWIYAHLVRQNHEYLADESALQRTADPAIYQATLLNQLLGDRVFSLTNSFSYSLNKKRFKMMKKKIDSPFRKLRILLILPLVAMLFYAFATPDYQYGDDNSGKASDGKVVNVKGQVIKSDGTPLYGTTVILRGSTIGIIADPEGKFELKDVPSDGELVFTFVGFKTVIRKVTNQPMKIVMEVEKVGIDQVTVVGYGTPPPPLDLDVTKELEGPNPPLVFLDGIPITKAAMDRINPETIGSISVLKNKSATDLYGEHGKNGVILITTKAKSGNDNSNVNLDKKDEVRVEEIYGLIKMINSATPPLIFLDGVLIAQSAMKEIKPDQIESMNVLKGEELINLYGEKGKNGAVMIITKKAKAGNVSDYNLDNSDKKVNQEKGDNVFVVVEEMPEFPGGEKALKEFIGRTVKYPADAIKENIQGKVFVTFTVKVDGTVGDAKVARGVNPLLDNEALRVVNLLPVWKPGKQRGQDVNVAYTIPVQFALDGGKTKQPVSNVEPKINEKGEKEVFVVVEEMPEFPGGEKALREFIAKVIKYPEDAKKEKIQGKVLVSFVVSSEGKVGLAKIERSVNPALDAEAMRVIGIMPDWKPGKQRGKAVSVTYTIPIEFKLQ